MTPYEHSFDAMGSRIRLIVDGGQLPALAAEQSEAWAHDFDARMSRFRPDSELCRLNAYPHEAVPGSVLLRATVGAALWAAQRSGGLVDPTLVDEIERAGYATSRIGVEPASLADALAAAPPRAPASPNPAARWRLVSVDDGDGVIHRPTGVRLDSGGVGKGLAADALARRLARFDRVAIDCGGDVRVAGPASRTKPFEVEIDHPLEDTPAHRFALGDGAVATSGLRTRVWQMPDGSFAHHLLDPATGRPAWTGLIQVSAIASSALEAETLAKTALLAGAERARELLAPLGGALVHDDGSVELIGSLRFEEVAA